MAKEFNTKTHLIINFQKYSFTHFHVTYTIRWPHYLPSFKYMTHISTFSDEKDNSTLVEVLQIGLKLDRLSGRTQWRRSWLSLVWWYHEH